MLTLRSRRAARPVFLPHLGRTGDSPGDDRSLAAGVSHLGAVLVGVVNAVGGGVLRDVLTREEPVLFKPGQYYGTAAALGAFLYVGFRATLEMNPQPACGDSLDLRGDERGLRTIGRSAVR